MSQYITNPEAVAAAVTQIHDWIRESPANQDQILNHFAVLHAQGDPLRIAAFTLLTSSEIMDNLRGGSSNLSRAVESMHQAVQYLNQAAEDNLATMTLLTYPLARSGIHIHNDHLVCPLHDRPHLPAAQPDPPWSPLPPPSLPQAVATIRPSATAGSLAADSGSPPHEPPFTAAAPAVILVTQTTTTTPDSPPYQPQETPPTSPPMTPRSEITNTIPPRHRTSPHLSVDSHGIEQITQTRSSSPPSYFCQRWDCHSRNKQTYSQVETYNMDEGPNTEEITVVNLCFRCNRECLHFING
ncbi:hypothetical protein AX16_000882 [Volvariella volvacea WC 439]|nr:hypothetical protein AX16_000882 [Volvariella volvacea WC 439]